jgi:hypothetical protein
VRVAAGVRVRSVGREVVDDPEPNLTRLRVMREPTNDRDAGAFVAVDRADHEHAGTVAGVAEAARHDASPEHRVPDDPGGLCRHRPADRCRLDRHGASMAETS